VLWSPTSLVQDNVCCRLLLISFTRNPFIFSVKEKISALANLTIAGFAVTLIASILGLLQKENWAKNPWLIPVILALAWGVLQDQ
jgi:hypothetical protein